MAVTKVGIIYSVSQSKRRRIIIPTDDAEFAMARGPLSPTSAGERLLIVPLTTATAAGFDPDQYLATQLGQAAQSDRCCVIDPTISLSGDHGNVVAAIHADPAVDTIPNFTIVQSDFGQSGDRWDGTNWWRRYAVINPTTLNVDQISWISGTNLAPTSPVSGDVLIASTTLQAGGAVP